MSIFNDILKDDAINVFVNPDEFGESIVYENKQGTQRTINAVVLRGDISARLEVNHATGESITVVVANDSTDGVASNEIDLGGSDVLIVPWKEGATATASDRHPITAMPMQDSGMLTFTFNKGF